LKQKILIIGVITHLILLILAVRYYQERTIFSDIAFQTFLMINEEGLQTMVGRYISGVTHWLPWVCIQFGLPLKVVLMNFSLAFGLWYAAAFVICTQVLKQWKLGLVLLLFSTLMVKDSFYWITSELPQGMALLIICFAWLLKKGEFASFRWWDWVIWPFLTVTLVYSHPMLVFPFVFLGLFFLIENKGNRALQKLLLFTLGLFLSIVFIKTKILPLNWYDAMSMERSAEIWARFPHWFDLTSNHDFLKWCLHDYYWLPILLVLNTYYYISKKSWLKLLLMLGFTAFYLLLVNVSFAKGDLQFYLEALYLPLVVMLGLPFVWDVLPFEAKPNWAIGLLVVIMATSLVRINHAHKRWTQRLDWEQKILTDTQNLPNKKLILAEKDVPMQLLGMSWGTSYEFLLLSALQHPDSTRLIIVDEDPKRFDKDANRGDIFIGEFKNYELNGFDVRYFRVGDRSGYIKGYNNLTK
jgi:hypothetical protein